LNFKKRREGSNKFPHTPTEKVERPRYPLAASSVLILTQPSEGNSHLTGEGQRTLPIQVFIPKNLITPKSNTPFFIEALDEFS